MRFNLTSSGNPRKRRWFWPRCAGVAVVTLLIWPATALTLAHAGNVWAP